MKLGIVIITYNLDSRIFILQMDAIKMFCKDDYTIEIIDNSTDQKKATDIKYHAEVRNIKYTRTYSVNLNGSESHVFAANFSYNLLKDNFDVFAYFDHDCIPIADFSVIGILGDKMIAGIGQGAKKTYIWPGCLFFKKDNDIDFSTDKNYGLDTGGKLYKIIDKYGEDNCIFFNEMYHQNPYFNGKYNFYTIIQNTFIHFINSSNWSGEDAHEERINSLLNIIKEKIYVNA